MPFGNRSLNDDINPHGFHCYHEDGCVAKTCCFCGESEVIHGKYHPVYKSVNMKYVKIEKGPTE